MNLNPFWEKIVLLGVSALLAGAAHFVVDDPAVRGLLMTLSGAPAGGALFARANERQLARRERDQQEGDSAP